MKTKICKKHNPIVFSLKIGGHLSVCMTCKKILVAPANSNITQDEINALLDFAAYLNQKKTREHKKSRKKLNSLLGGGFIDDDL